MTDAPLLSCAAAAALARRPVLWFEAVRAVFRLARRGWWRRWPPAPAPDPLYLAWRRQTAYGGAAVNVDAAAQAADLVSFLEFSRALRREAR